MRVLHITNNYPTKKHPIFGVFVKEQIDSLSSQGVENEVLFINGREKGKLEYVRIIQLIRKKLKENHYDLIHCHHALSAMSLILSGGSKKNNIVVSFQNDPVNEYGKKIFSFIKRKTDGWIFKNNSSLINDEYSFYLPNGVNMDFFNSLNKEEAKKKLKFDLNTIHILFVSSNRIRAQKRNDRFKEVMQILKEKYNYNNIKEIQLINTKREEIPLSFKGVDLHLLTSDYEGSPNSVKESMACETPVVSTNVGNVMELLENVNGSYVSNKNTPEDLAKLVDLALKKEGVEQNSREELMRLNLDMDSVAIRLMKIYTKIINKKKR